MPFTQGSVEERTERESRKERERENEIEEEREKKEKEREREIYIERKREKCRVRRGRRRHWTFFLLLSLRRTRVVFEGYDVDDHDGLEKDLERLLGTLRMWARVGGSNLVSLLCICGKLVSY
jgi:hypothetical protein